jgi:hypothetical protein
MEPVASLSSRGHHSGISKAIDAHRQQVEERQFRKSKKDFDPMSANGMSPSGVSAPSTQYVVANQVTGANNEGETEESGEEEKKYGNPMIEPATSMSKMASVWAFQNVEPGKPSFNDPIPKGSYLDVQG